MRLVCVVSFLIFFFVPDLSVGTEREKERKMGTKREREGESERADETSQTKSERERERRGTLGRVFSHPQGQGCHRRESTVSGSFRVTKL